MRVQNNEKTALAADIAVAGIGLKLKKRGQRVKERNSPRVLLVAKEEQADLFAEKSQ